MPAEAPAQRAISPAAWAALGVSLCMIVGWNWDISWHRSIGRDTVWTAPHVFVYIAIAGTVLVSGMRVLGHTFGRWRGAPGLRVLGFAGPSAAFFLLWACLTELIGVVFDNWWHDIYGLDIGVFSPPHYFLSFGVAAFFCGNALDLAVRHNTATEARRPGLRWLLVGTVATLLCVQLLGLDPSHGPLGMRTTTFLVSCSAIVPFVLTGLERYLDWRWAGVTCSAIYIALMIAQAQIFQLFPATPRFGPVYHPDVRVLVPPMFPVLVIVPALLLALLRRAPAGRPRLGHALGGAAFAASFLATNWAMSALLMSPAGDNRFFGGGYPGSVFEAEFRPSTPWSPGVPGLVMLAVAMACAGLSSAAGERLGAWLQGLDR